jgi:monofunctional biosynthetic peptidoglycan transglycosylase
VPYGRISTHLKRAVLVAEDSAFYQHDGLDYGQIRESIEFNLEEGRMARGASTITQQLAKNLYLSPSRNPLRKVKEAVTTYRLEAALGKDRILELYLNVAEMGEEIWGVEAASRYYFDRSAAELNLDQAAAIAGMLPFPLRSNPGFRPGRMASRQHLIIRLLRGEPVEVPPVPEEEAMPVPVESLPPTPLDTLALPVDSTAPRPDSNPDTLPASPDSTVPTDSSPPKDP